ncbi:MAG: endonuclease III [Treponema sp.]|nr:endonuclease III [Treponema sp.]
MKNKPKINWSLIFNALEKWKARLSAKDEPSMKDKPSVEEGKTNIPVDPSVTTIAEHFRYYDGDKIVSDPWAVLVSTIISLRTKDEVTLVASERLLKKAKTPALLHDMKEAVIEKLIYPAGFYRNKTTSLKKIAKILLEQYDGKVPSTMDKLLALPGVGRKTANLVLVEAFDIPAICVDIHVHRISNRCGWLESKTPDDTEMILREILPGKYWKRINYLLVLYGQRVCRPVSPFCSQCVIRKYCERSGVVKAR